MSNDRKNRIDEYFRAGLNNLDVVPPPETWDQIAASLDKKGKGRKIIFWVAMAATIAVFAGVSSILYFQGNGSKPAIENASISADHHNNSNVAANAPDHTSSPLTGTDASPKNAVSADHASQDHSKVSSTFVIKYSKSIRAFDKSETIVANTTVKSSVSRLPGIQVIAAENNVQGKNKETLTQNAVVLDEITGYVFIPRSIPAKLIENPYFADNQVLPLPVLIRDATPVYDTFIVLDNQDDPKEKGNKWALVGQMAPLYSYRNISAVDIPGISKASINKVEKAAITYASGILVDYSASSRLSFQTGVYYMEMGQEVANVTYLSGTNTKSYAYNNSLAQSGNNISAVSNSTGIIKTSSGTDLYFSGSSTSDRTTYSPGNLALSPADNNTKYNIQQAFEFIEVPFLTKYKLIDRKLGLHVLGGLSTHVLVGSRTDVSSAGNSREAASTDGLKPVNYSSSVGFGVIYKIKGNFVLSLEPVFKYYINSFNTAETIKTHPFALGLYSGFSYRF